MCHGYDRSTKFFAGLLFSFLSLIASSVTPAATLELPAVFSDHGVVQRDQPVTVWGWAEAGQTVTVQFKGQVKTTETPASGRWSVQLESMPADANAATMTVSTDDTELVINDLLVGDVWLCSGQSNMEWPVHRSANAAEEIKNGNHPLIRQIKAPRRESFVPLEDIDAQWQVASPETVGGFTAVGYYFARHLQSEINVPIGLLKGSWGGTPIEPWVPREGFSAVASTQDIYNDLMQRDPATEQYQQIAMAYIDELKQWQTEAALAVRQNDRLAEPPVFPATIQPYTEHRRPSMLYNGMLHGFVQYAIKGTLWYQGESNRARYDSYVDLTAALLYGWRAAWQDETLPFYFVQIAPFRYSVEHPHILPKFWEAQEQITKVLPHTGMVVINDIGMDDDIHPINKQDVGLRLANLALKETYGDTDRLAHSPTFDRFEVKDDTLILTFSNVGTGLKSRDGLPLTHFEICSADEPWRAATATILGPDRLALQAEGIVKPTAVRFAWHKLAKPNLVNSAGLPTGAFRAGEPGDYDPLRLHVPSSRGYELVYDLDLAGLGNPINYNVDRSDELPIAFDRVAYFVELQRGENFQYVFVAVDPFTDDLKKIGVPIFGSGAQFQQPVTIREVTSNVGGLPTAQQMRGNIEFWPNNYGTNNALGLPAANRWQYDYDDTFNPNVEDGYGSMQIHLTNRQQTLFALNGWKSGRQADIGIGNATGQHADWTFANNASQYDRMRLRVLVRPIR